MLILSPWTMHEMFVFLIYLWTREGRIPEVRRLRRTKTILLQHDFKNLEIPGSWCCFHCAEVVWKMGSCKGSSVSQEIWISYFFAVQMLFYCRLILNVYMFAMDDLLNLVKDGGACTWTSCQSGKQNIPFSHTKRSSWRFLYTGGTYLLNIRFIDLGPMIVVIHQGSSKGSEESDYLTADHDEREIIQNNLWNGHFSEWWWHLDETLCWVSGFEI